jgi:hypothetical protein
MSYVVCRMSYVVCRMSYVVCRMSYVVCRMSYVGCRMSYVVCRMSYVVCRMSYVVCRMSYVVCRMSYVVCPGHVDSGPCIEWNLESLFFLSSSHMTSWLRPKSGSLFSSAPALCFSLALPECLLDHLSIPCFFSFTGTPFIGHFNRFSSDDSSRASPCLPFLPALCSPPCCHFLARFSHCCHFSARCSLCCHFSALCFHALIFSCPTQLPPGLQILLLFFRPPPFSCQYIHLSSFLIFLS